MHNDTHGDVGGIKELQHEEQKQDQVENEQKQTTEVIKETERENASEK